MGIQASPGSHRNPGQLREAEFASDGTVLRALLDFALLPHRRKKAASVEPRAAQAAGKLRATDDSESLPWIIRLAPSAAARIASAFFEFLMQGRLTSRVAAMPTGRESQSNCVGSNLGPDEFENAMKMAKQGPSRPHRARESKQLCWKQLGPGRVRKRNANGKTKAIATPPGERVKAIVLEAIWAWTSSKTQCKWHTKGP